MPSPTYGWLIGLTDYMNAHHADQWAYTGSFALYIHAAAHGLQARDPNDVDIVYAGAIDKLYGELRPKLGADVEPPPAPKAPKGHLKNAQFYQEADHTCRANIDLLSARSFGNNLKNVITFQQHTSLCRVLPLEILKEKKLKATKDVSEKSERYAQCQQDLELLNALIG